MIKSRNLKAYLKAEAECHALDRAHAGAAHRKALALSKLTGSQISEAAKLTGVDRRTPYSATVKVRVAAVAEGVAV